MHQMQWIVSAHIHPANSAMRANALQNEAHNIRGFKSADVTSTCHL